MERTMKQSRDPYNKVGRFILEVLEKGGVSYGYACKWKNWERDAINRDRIKTMKELMDVVILPTAPNG